MYAVEVKMNELSGDKLQKDIDVHMLKENFLSSENNEKCGLRHFSVDGYLEEYLALLKRRLGTFHGTRRIIKACIILININMCIFD